MAADGLALCRSLPKTRRKASSDALLGTLNRAQYSPVPQARSISSMCGAISSADIIGRVEKDQARKGSETGEGMRRPRLFPPQIEVRDEAGHEDKIERAVADNLIGDAQLTAFGVTRFGWGHGLLPDRSRERYSVARSGAIGFIFSPNRRPAASFSNSYGVEPGRSRMRSGRSGIGATPRLDASRRRTALVQPTRSGIRRVAAFLITGAIGNEAAPGGD